MESFFRYISYVDYYKKGEKIRNVGFLRWKLHNNEHRIEFQIKDVFGTQGDYEIKEKNTEKAIGKIRIDQGIGSFNKKFTSMTASGERYIDTQKDRLYLSDIDGFVIELNGNEYLRVDVDLKQEKKKDSFEKKAQNDIFMEKIEAASESVLKEGVEDKYKEQKYSELSSDGRILISEKDFDKYEVVNLEKEKRRYSEKDFNKYENINLEKRRHVGIISGKEDENYVDIISEKEDKKIKIIEPIHENKWEQLCKKYQQIHPFPNKKVFLSIKPDDFIILQQGYQKLVHNSFLLHGFYNYGHMILGKLNNEEEAPVYIGVPGVYYEREKQAAQMFGFVGFESTEHPVQAGSYGYYMIEVEI